MESTCCDQSAQNDLSREMDDLLTSDKSSTLLTTATNETFPIHSGMPLWHGFGFTIDIIQE